MKKGAYALIFFFWAFITIITPTLVQWSAAAGSSESKEEITTAAGKETSQSEGFTIARKMMKLTQEIGLQGMRKAPPRPPKELAVAVLTSPAPAPNDNEGIKEEALEVVSTSRRLFLRGL